MFNWVLGFLVIAIIAALLGFIGVAGVAAGIVHFLLFSFTVIFVITLLIMVLRGKPPRY